MNALPAKKLQRRGLAAVEERLRVGPVHTSVKAGPSPWS